MRRTLDLVAVIGITAALLFAAQPLWAPVYTYVRLEVANSWSGFQHFAAGFDRPTVKVVEVCPSGCTYTTLNAACAANTSTSSNPIRFHVHAATYAAADTMCSGQDHVSFVGDGIGVTILQGVDHGFGSGTTNNCVSEPSACKGALNMGTSTNIEVSSMTMQGTRGIWANALATGGGKIFIHDTELIANTTGGDEDCFFAKAPASGSRFIFANNVCTTNSDGFTLDDIQDDTTAVYSSGNKMYSGTAVTTQNAAFALRSIPCIFNSTSDQIRYVGKKSGGGGALYGYQIDGSPATAGKSCSGGGALNITAAQIYIQNTSSNGDGGNAYGIETAVNGTEAGIVNVIGSNIKVINGDATTGITYGIAEDNQTTTVFNVVGGIIRTTGAATNTYDLSAPTNGPINIFPGVNYLTRRGNETLASMIGLTVGTPGLTDNDTDSGVGISLNNTDAANNEASPYLRWTSSAQSPESMYANVAATGEWQLLDGSFNQRVKVTQAGQVTITGGDLNLSKSDGVVTIGNGANNDNLELLFNATTVAHIGWNNTNKRLGLTNVDIFRFSTKATAPATCSIGDFYVDTSGAYCACTSANTWTDMTSLVGSCV